MATTKKRKTRKASPPRKQRVMDRDDGDAHGSKALVIVESPAKAKTIGRYLGSDYRVRATIGHLRDLPEKKLGIDLQKGFEPEYVTIPGKEKTLAELKEAAK